MLIGIIVASVAVLFLVIFLTGYVKASPDKIGRAHV